MLGIAGEVKAPTYAELYSGDWLPLHVVGVWVNRIGKVHPSRSKLRDGAGNPPSTEAARRMGRHVRAAPAKTVEVPL